MVEAATSNQGEDVIQTSLRRSTQGLLITVKAHPRVEEFMNRLSGGNIVPVSTIGRNWITEWEDKDGKIHSIGPNLRAYQFYHAIEPFRTNDGQWVGFERLGHPLSEVMESRSSLGGIPEDSLNLSFLRLVGISSPEGVQFLLKSVHSMGALRKMRDAIQNAQNMFYNDYIRTVEYVVTTATQVI